MGRISILLAKRKQQKIKEVKTECKQTAVNYAKAKKEFSESVTAGIKNTITKKVPQQWMLDKMYEKSQQLKESRQKLCRLRKQLRKLRR